MTTPAPIFLATGSESALLDKAVGAQRRALQEAIPSAEVSETSAAAYKKGDLSVLLSQSLFADKQIVLIDEVERASDDFIEDFARYVANPAADVWVILRHGGGNRASRVTKAIASAGFPVVKCELQKGYRGDRQRLDLVVEEVRSRRATIEPAAAEALAGALSESLAELLSAARQLADDSGGTVTEQTVRTFFRGRVETKPFEVSDRLTAGDGAGAVLAARQAAASGAAPVVVVAALASAFRGLAKVSVPGLTQADLGMPPMAADRARRNQRLWSQEALGAAILRIARADSDVKGGSRDAQGAVELCIMDVARIFAAG